MFYGYLSINEIKTEDFVLKSKKPFFFKVYKEDNLWVSHEESISLYVFSDSLYGLRKEIKEQLSFMWIRYVINRKNTCFSTDVAQVKNNLLKLYF